MTQITLETIYTELASFRSEVDARLNTIEARVIGLPIIGESISVLQRNLRMVTAAINDMVDEIVTLAFLGKRLNQVSADVANLRNDMMIVTAMISRVETSLAALVEEHRANHRQTARLIERMRKLEATTAP